MSIDQSQLDSKYGDILREYCQLASQKHLSERDAEQLTAILILAETDGALSFLLNEADHFLAHELGLLGSIDRSRQNEQQALLRGQIDFQPPLVNRSKVPALQNLVFSHSELFRQKRWQVIGCL
jgi:hypothetical protein